jgi:hypothetical protein
MTDKENIRKLSKISMKNMPCTLVHVSIASKVDVWLTKQLLLHQQAKRVLMVENGVRITTQIKISQTDSQLLFTNL